ncbi:MAG TPA: hypothetical protein VH682_12000, partial [Gemmataceae bacterium]
MLREIIRRGRFLSIILCAFGLILLAGCGGLRRVPVSGTVTLNGEPLPGGVISFSPDTSKGNTVRADCTGPVKDGHFTLQTSGVTRAETGSGAVLGWYKVFLITNLPGQPKRKIDVNPKYLDPDKTPLSI